MRPKARPSPPRLLQPGQLVLKYRRRNESAPRAWRRRALPSRRVCDLQNSCSLRGHRSSHRDSTVVGHICTTSTAWTPEAGKIGRLIRCRERPAGGQQACFLLLRRPGSLALRQHLDQAADAQRLRLANDECSVIKWPGCREFRKTTLLVTTKEEQSRKVFLVSRARG